MSENEKKVESGTAEKPEKGRRRPRRLGLLAALLLVVLAVVALTTMEDGRHFASLRRWLMYGENSSSAGRYSYANDSANRFGRLGDVLVLANSSQISLLGDDGSVIYDQAASLGSPSLSVGRSLAAVCDVGGSKLYVLSAAGLERELTAEGGLCYYAARMNAGDYLAVTEQKSGYKAAVTVYDPGGEKVFSFDSHDNYLSDALVMPDNKRVAVVSLEPQEGVFASRLLIYNLATAELESSCLIRDGLVLDLACQGRQVTTLCDTGLSMWNLDGENLLWEDFGSLYLHGCAMGGKDFCALLLGRYQAGNVCRLTTWSAQGEAIASLELTEEVLDLSAAGDYLAVLFSDSLVIYTRDLQEHARLEDTGYAGHILLGEDGTCLVLSGTSAWRYLP